jgi:uncharacterized protein
VKRLIGRHGTRRPGGPPLRAGRFVDLMAVTRQGLQASVESYSLKELESLFGFQRAMDLRAAGAALRRVARTLELAGPDEITAADRAQVEAYNRDDCLSTAALRGWLAARREELEQQGQPVPVPEERAGRPARRSKNGPRRWRRSSAADPGPGRGPLELGPWSSARWLLAHQLERFRREDKSAWWEYFRIHDLDPEELLEERKVIAGLRFPGAARRGRRAGDPSFTVTASCSGSRGPAGR